MSLAPPSEPRARPRRLAYVLKRFPRISETFVAGELIELERQGERVSVYAISRPDEPFSHGFVEELAAPVVYLPQRPIRQPLRVARALYRALRLDPRGWLRAATYALRRPRLVAWRRLLQATVLRDELERAGIDHCHAHFATAAARLANLAWRMGGPTYSVTAHAKDIYHRDVRLDHLRDKLAGASFVATVSERNRDYLNSILPAVRSHLHVVPNSVDFRRLGSPGDRRREPGLILSVARLVEKKGLADLVTACGLLVREGAAIRLEVVGDGPLREELEETAARLGVAARFRRALPQEEVLGRYRAASVFCLPCVVASTGDRDGLPTSVLEAMALGVPVVTTALNGLTEVVAHERTGLLVPERDPVALSRALGRLLSEPELAARLSTEARRHVQETFSLERSATLLRSLFPLRPDGSLAGNGQFDLLRAREAA
jgi:colanic acid/amylovoran biosynthesis glycosyltransferase